MSHEAGKTGTFYTEYKMPRHRRRTQRPRRPAIDIAADTPIGGRVTSVREWHWRTFPVYFAFSAAVFITAVLAGVLVSLGYFTVLLFIGAALFAGGLAHLLVVGLLGGRLRRNLRQ
jgi:hypothetical protein